jgi:hypothetical protein
VHFLPGQHPGALGHFAMVPSQWLDPAYVAAYNWDYIRRTSAAEFCKLPGVLQPSPFAKGELKFFFSVGNLIVICIILKHKTQISRNSLELRIVSIFLKCSASDYTFNK